MTLEKKSIVNLEKDSFNFPIGHSRVLRQVHCSKFPILILKFGSSQEIQCIQFYWESCLILIFYQKNSYSRNLKK